MVLLPRISLWWPILAICSVKVVQSTSTIDSNAMETSSMNDESKSIFYRLMVGPESGKCFLIKCIVPVVMFSDVKIMILRCISWFLLESSLPIHVKLNSSAYCTILSYNVLPILWQLYVLDLSYVQDDSGNCSVARSIIDWYSDNSFNRLDYFTQSPQLSTMNIVWDVLNCQIKGYDNRRKSEKKHTYH